MFVLAFRFVAVEMATSFSTKTNMKSTKNRCHNPAPTTTLCLAMFMLFCCYEQWKGLKVVQKTPIIGVFQGFLTPITCKKDPKTNEK